MSTTCCFFTKDPNDQLDWSMDWNLFLPTSDAITSSTWTVPGGITKINDLFSARSTHIWVSGGTLDATYILANRITTREGRIAERSLVILIKEM